MQKQNQIIRVVRNGYTESLHRFSYVAVCEGRVVGSNGGGSTVVSARSTFKPLILAALFDQNDVKAQGFSDAELSVMMSSHSGQARHAATVRELLARYGLCASDLRCGRHLPYGGNYDAYFAVADLDERQLFHNCSGKHAAMLIYCVVNGIPTEDYFKPNHAVSKRVLRYVSENTAFLNDREFGVGTDGCNVPCYYMSLETIANTYAVLIDGKLRYLASAALACPFDFCGENRTDAALIERLGYFVKNGSEGLFAAYLPKYKTALVVKVENGNNDIAPIALANSLLCLDCLSDEERDFITQFTFAKIFTNGGIEIGKICV